jgi:hypothetical protein
MSAKKRKEKHRAHEKSKCADIILLGIKKIEHSLNFYLLFFEC